MAFYDSSGSEDEFHSMSVSGDEPDADDEAMPFHDADFDAESLVDMTPPTHPFPSLQAAFEESIVEAAEADADYEFDSDQQYNAEMRRRELLAAKRYEDAKRITRWKQNQRRGNHHPYQKLISQIVFGMHLLQQRQAKSNEEVAKILQSHVNQVDAFLERTSDDFELAIGDVQERIRYLRLPMQHMDVFQTMLDEKQFRSDLLKGNEKIEKIFGRTIKALNDALHDVQCGLRSTQELRQYLNGVERHWPSGDAGIAKVFAAMRGNEQGWMEFLKELVVQGQTLQNELVELNNVSSEISKLAGEASRRNMEPTRTLSPTESSRSGKASTARRSKYAKESSVPRKPGPWVDKPLPKEPDSRTGAVHVAIAKPHPVPFETRFERPREQAPVPGSQNPSSLTKTPTKSTVQNSVMQAAREDPRDRPGYLRESGPLRSNPPDRYEDGAPRSHTRNSAHSHSRSTSDMLKAHPKTSTKSRFSRSRSQGTNAIAKSPSISIPRKRIGTEVDRSQTEIKLVPKSVRSTEEDRKGLSSINTGFSRRLSGKLKTFSPRIKSTPRQDVVPKPIDSGYSVERKRSTSSPTDYTEDRERELTSGRRQDAYLDPKNDSKGNNADKSLSGSRLGLFPKTTGPLTPSQASQQSKEYLSSPNSKTYDSSVTNSPRTMESSKTSRTLSIRKLFSRKGDGSSVLAV
ncbi:Hypothetical predicted protein [Lecanosticta acicola]|uniref:Uncharacterized protein n=1 Tax=Lecanosticta acicola TaxID=111012 RepID=A0AAI8Z1I9_9PEZI|nr:Hypothetical predicted protein [Lecanosticta acicola]